MLTADIASHLLDGMQTLGVLGILGCLGYLRGISKRLFAYEHKQFRDELHLLDHEHRLANMERKP